MSSHLVTASNEFEAEIIRERLAEAGIIAVVERNIGPRAYAGGHRDVFVEEDDLERAREVLKAVEDVDEDELTRLSEESSAERGGSGDLPDQ